MIGATIALPHGAARERNAVRGSSGEELPIPDHDLGSGFRAECWKQVADLHRGRLVGRHQHELREFSHSLPNIPFNIAAASLDFNRKAILSFFGHKVNEPRPNRMLFGDLVAVPFVLIAHALPPELVLKAVFAEIPATFEKPASNQLVHFLRGIEEDQTARGEGDGDFLYQALFFQGFLDLGSLPSAESQPGVSSGYSRERLVKDIL